MKWREVPKFLLGVLCGLIIAAAFNVYGAVSMVYVLITNGLIKP